jgi:hypothetical protein
MPGIVLVVDKGMLNGAPSATSATDPIEISLDNAVDAEIVLFSFSGTSLSVSYLGANDIDGTYVSTGPAALVLTRSPDVQIYRLGVTPWAYVKLQFVASGASALYSANVRQYSL